MIRPFEPPDAAGLIALIHRLMPAWVLTERGLLYWLETQPERARHAPAPAGGANDLIQVGKLALRFMNTPAGRQIQRSIFGVLRKRR